MTHSGTFNRTDEVGVLRRLPKKIGHGTVLLIGEFTPGEPGHYATVRVLMEWGLGRFGVHRAVYQDDRPEGHEYEWTVASSHYVNDWDDAKRLFHEH